MIENHYETFNLENFSEIGKIKSQYKKLMKIHHPDKGGNSEKFNFIKNSFSFLENAENKRLYDEKLKSMKNILNRLSSITRKSR